jgi:hypothetical protein
MLVPMIPDAAGEAEVRMFSVHLDRTQRLIRVTLEGFWDTSTIERYVAELLPCIKAAREDYDEVLVLSDARNFPVQAADVVAAFREGGGAFGIPWDRMAVVMTSTLAKMQGARTVSDPGTQFFTSVEDAEAWLLKR